MAVGDGTIRWFSPDPRGVIPLDTFHISRRLARVVRSGAFEIAIDRGFDAVIRACAGAERDDDGAGTWIDAEIYASYVALHQAGYAHSVETWQDGRLAGGLYGVAIAGAFFGESMFHHVTDASKVALAALVDRLRAPRLRAARYTVGHAPPGAVRRNRDPPPALSAAARRSPRKELFLRLITPNALTPNS